MKIEPELVGRTYDDFLFRPRKGIVATRKAVALTSPLTRSIPLELPVVAANMDSVTGGEMAKAMALEGGLGFIHRGMPIKAQVREVEWVKRSHGFVVEEPFRVARGTPLGEARQLMRKRGTSLLVEDADGSGILAGVLSARDVPWFEGGDDQAVEAFMTPFDALRTAPPGVSLDEAERLLYENRVEKLPLVDEERRIRGLITKRDVILHRHRPDVSKDAKGRLLVGAATGATGDFLERAEALVGAGADVILVDVAHAHSEVMAHALDRFRARLPDTPLVAGNVGTAEGARFLADLGVDGIKVGIGPGRGCRTRLETAAGVPQLQAVREAWLAVGDEVPIIADGGVKDDKDIFLAIVCGASTVMLGSALSGTRESPGHVIEDPATGQKLKIYRGMTSPQAVLRSLHEDVGGEAEVARALETPAEGQEVQVPFKGNAADILARIRGHLRSAVSYAGGESLAAARAAVVRAPMEHLIPLSEASRRESYER
ncbi:MAG: IMP dehydrogenase [Gemmatimonadota bacterium]|jgi:IMP dehydrogenase